MIFISCVLNAYSLYVSLESYLSVSDSQWGIGVDSKIRKFRESGDRCNWEVDLSLFDAYSREIPSMKLFIKSLGITMMNTRSRTHP